MLGVLKSLFRVCFRDRAAARFAVGVLLGLGFSISIILATVGIMDGFEVTLKMGLKNSEGDLTFFSHDGFFVFDKELESQIKDLGVNKYSPFVQTEGFILHDEVSKGVLVRAISGESYTNVVGLDVTPAENSVVIGSELADYLQLKMGDSVVIGFASGNKEFDTLPLLKRFTISKVITHGVYQKDLRVIYIDLGMLQKSLNLDDRVNLVAMNVPNIKFDFREDNSSYMQEIISFKSRLRQVLGFDFSIKPFWHEFSTLLQAVKVEKFMISIIFQVVVLISIFNVLAFLVFINEKKAKEIFLLKTLGMSQRQFVRIWMMLVAFAWAFSCLLATLLVKVFDIGLQNLSLFQLPGNVYHLERLSIILDATDYLMVFSLAFVWIFVISYFGLRRIKKKSILHGLRKEFA